LHNKQGIEKIFPNLSNGGYSLTSPATPEYNCIAWAAGEDEVWWWPDPNNDYYWPSEVPRVETIEAFIKAYEGLGYSVCSNAELENGFEKVAIYINSNGEPTHVARQLDSGDWTSKLGQSEDIKHLTLDGLVGNSYGSVAVILKRPVKA
jgi:hypothetical protein